MPGLRLSLNFLNVDCGYRQTLIHAGCKCAEIAEMETASHKCARVRSFMVACFKTALQQLPEQPAELNTSRSYIQGPKFLDREIRFSDVEELSI